VVVHNTVSTPVSLLEERFNFDLTKAYTLKQRKTLFILLLILTSPAYLYCQTGIKKKGKYTEKYPEGQIRCTGHFRSYRKEGEWRYYDEKRRLIRIENFTADIRDGKCSEFFETGQPKNSGYYVSGKRTGPWITWYPDGKTQTKMVYSNDKPDGTYSRWYPGGVMEETFVYNNGWRDGPFGKWYSNGNKREEGIYSLERKEGQWTCWDEQGRVLSVRNYMTDKKNGLCTDYTEEKKVEEIYYVNGKRTGLYSKWYENGNLKESGQFVNDKHDSLRQKWYSGGAPEEEVFYLHGKEQGAAKLWYANGKRKEVRYYLIVCMPIILSLAGRDPRCTTKKVSLKGWQKPGLSLGFCKRSVFTRRTEETANYSSIIPMVKNDAIFGIQKEKWTEPVLSTIQMGKKNPDETLNKECPQANTQNGMKRVN
jgi:antitoxin component YwqK of YwqJK toxin-antitoxin module